jgi:hypothetical protein
MLGAKDKAAVEQCYHLSNSNALLKKKLFWCPFKRFLQNTKINAFFYLLSYQAIS